MRPTAHALLLTMFVAGSIVRDVAGQSLQSVPSVKPNQEIVVALVDGRRLAGRVVSLSADTLVLRIENRETPVPLTSIAEITSPGHTRRNLIVGVLAGVGGGVLVEQVARPPDDTRSHVTGPVVGSAIGAGMVMLLASGRPRPIWSALSTPVLSTSSESAERAALGVVDRHVWVMTSAGSTFEGRAASVTQTIMNVDTRAGITPIALDQIRRIETTRSRRSAVLWGAVIGTSAGVAVGVANAASSNGTEGVGTVTGLAAAGGVAGGLLGYALGGGRTTVFASSSSPPGKTFAMRFEPRMSPSGAWVRMQWVW